MRRPSAGPGWPAGGTSVLRDLLLLGSWPACWDVSEQPFREALGGALAFEAFTQSVNVSCRYCVLRNDAAAAVASFRKGSTQSPKIQRCALRLDRAAAAVHVTCLPLHGPGITLVAEGIDGASCSGAELGDGVNVDAILGPDVSDQLWSTAARAAADAGLGRATVDAFATESKARFPRLARFHDPGSEAICGLSMPDWARSACPTCGVDHRDVVYAYMPDHLVRAAVEKKMVDRTLCVLVVPVAILAPYWNHLLSASVLPLRAPYADGFARVRRPAILVQNLGPGAPAELAVFACDFSLLARLPPLASCPGRWLAVGDPCAAVPVTRPTRSALMRPCGPRATNAGRTGPSRGDGLPGRLRLAGAIEGSYCVMLLSVL
jgi:hypothetical protein